MSAREEECEMERPKWTCATKTPIGRGAGSALRARDSSARAPTKVSTPDTSREAY